MNAMTIILSTTASLLVAALILFWQNDNKSAKNEPLVQQQQLEEKQREIDTLKARLKLHEDAMANKERGIAGNSSPYTSSIKGQSAFASDSKKLEAAQIQAAKIKDRLSASQLANAETTYPLVETDPLADASPDDLAAAEITSSALSAATSDTFNEPSASDLLSSEKQLIDSNINKGLSNLGENLTENQQQKRRNAIRNSKTYAVVTLVDSSPENAIVLAKMNDGAYLDEGSTLAIRRRNTTGIVGKVKVISIRNYPGQGNIAVIQPDSLSYGGAGLVIKENDELILPPTWESGR